MSDSTPNASTNRPDGLFATTHWSVVLAAQRGDSAKAFDALSQLCQTYWFPLYAWLRRRGHAAHDAQDLVQSFFAHLLDQSRLGKVGPEKGRFRSFLLASLNHFVSDERSRANAQRRGGGKSFISLDAQEANERYQLEPVDQLSAVRLFDRRWPMAVLEETLRALRAEQQAAGKGDEFRLLESFLTEGSGEEGYARVTTVLQKPPGTIAVAVHRLRCRYRELLREQIAATVSSPAEIEAEMRELLAVLRS